MSSSGCDLFPLPPAASPPLIFPGELPLPRSRTPCIIVGRGAVIFRRGRAVAAPTRSAGYFPLGGAPHAAVIRCMPSGALLVTHFPFLLAVYVSATSPLRGAGAWSMFHRWLASEVSPCLFLPAWWRPGLKAVISAFQGTQIKEVLSFCAKFPPLLSR